MCNVCAGLTIDVKGVSSRGGAHYPAWLLGEDSVDSVNSTNVGDSKADSVGMHLPE